MWGLTAVYAFRAYEERTFLDDATAIWEEITPWKITQDDANRESHPLKNGTLSSVCGGGRSISHPSLGFSGRLTIVSSISHWRNILCGHTSSKSNSLEYTLKIRVQHIDDPNKNDLGIVSSSEG